MTLSITQSDQKENATTLILRLNTKTTSSTASTTTTTTTESGGNTKDFSFFTVNLKRFMNVEIVQSEKIGDKGAIEFAKALLTGACPRAKVVHLAWNQIKYTGIKALSDAFLRGACGQLQVLDLRFNSFDSKCMDLLLQVFDQGGLNELVELNLMGNILGDEGAKVLCHGCLRFSLKSLKKIDIRQNKIKNVGLQAIWNVFTCETLLKFCPHLNLLDLRRNDANGEVTRHFLPCPPYLQL
jgi:Ran GTPase-activating protein (RanGAP) involved in mRNA processing and transport